MIIVNANADCTIFYEGCMLSMRKTVARVQQQVLPVGITIRFAIPFTRSSLGAAFIQTWLKFTTSNSTQKRFSLRTQPVLAASIQLTLDQNFTLEHNFIDIFTLKDRSMGKMKAAACKKTVRLDRGPGLGLGWDIGAKTILAFTLFWNIMATCWIIEDLLMYSSTPHTQR